MYIGDTITVKYSDGSTEKFQFLGPYSTIMWSRVQGSYRDPSGADPTKPATVGTPSANGSQINFPYSNARISVIPGMGSDSVTGIVSVGEIIYPDDASAEAGVASGESYHMDFED